jgi:alkylated DNA repair dioxygenase AlkB
MQGESKSSSEDTRTGAKVRGLSVLPGFVDEEDEMALYNMCMRQEWLRDISRDTLHYGKRYDYRERRLEPAPPIPEWLGELCQRVEKAGGFPSAIDQVIVNKYTTGQGISPHVDHVKLFGPVVATLTLGAAVPIKLSRGTAEVLVGAPRGSLLILKDESRYQWHHSLKVKGPGTRISVTFRTCTQNQ